jgi:hypothetical protein
MNKNTSPKVFLSHASEDKERFVLHFATELRARGVDVWLDRWEMLPGDSLVDKIFQEGIKRADAILIVLSKISVNKPWVREELNASFVSRVSKGTKLIPIVLDDCSVPEVLQSTLWEPVKDLQNVRECVDRVVAAVFKHSLKPPLGEAPSYLTIALHGIATLSDIDNLVLKLSCEELLSSNDHMIAPDKIFGLNSGLDIPKQEVLDSIEILEGKGFLTVSYYVGGGSESFGCYYEATTTGFDAYAQAYIPNYSDTISKAISLIVNEGVNTNEEIKERLQAPNYLIDHILLYLKERGLISFEEFLGGGIFISAVSASLRRSLRR